MLVAVSSSHNWKNIEKWWDRGEDAPIALWIGHHPAVLLGTQVKLDYPVSHWPSAGALLGEPLRLMATARHGEHLLVPAEAEIVIEGLVPRGVRVAEGPFGEFTGYAGEGTHSPVIRLERVSMRRSAVYHDFGSGLADALVPDNLLIEAKLYEIAVPAEHRGIKKNPSLRICSPLNLHFTDPIRPQFRARLVEARQQTSSATHCFSQAWAEGKLSRKQMGFWAMQHWYYIDRIPQQFGIMYTRCPDVDTRLFILETSMGKRPPGDGTRICSSISPKPAGTPGPR